MIVIKQCVCTGLYNDHLEDLETTNAAKFARLNDMGRALSNLTNNCRNVYYHQSEGTRNRRAVARLDFWDDYHSG